MPHPSSEFQYNFLCCAARQVIMLHQPILDVIVKSIDDLSIELNNEP